MVIFWKGGVPDEMEWHLLSYLDCTGSTAVLSWRWNRCLIVYHIRCELILIDAYIAIICHDVRLCYH